MATVETYGDGERDREDEQPCSPIACASAIEGWRGHDLRTSITPRAHHQYRDHCESDLRVSQSNEHQN